MFTYSNSDAVKSAVVTAAREEISTIMPIVLIIVGISSLITFIIGFVLGYIVG